ncbi:response regulator [Psychrobacillus lasiicapitis]|uniref:Response regulator n=1 Tax=Psychrobacillus lasiicapitis TaxID=1636719 RepID=A0A544TBN8_9BACI|nr:response regulator [Psychrobacillus lasiicapitis]TQR14872.1 response regulator [Psychrobacillus lasiicapitis]GGA20634.1 DNA-binding response regulator [Psychrobacillus lasiicapitis]
MRVLLIDDEEMALNVNENMLQELSGIDVVGKFTNPYLALEQIEKLDVEVVFLDMEMGEVHGLELAEVIMNKYNHVEILFVTAHPQYALEAFEVNAIDYLLKPLNKKRLKKAIDKTQGKLELYRESKKRNTVKDVPYYAKTLGNFHLLDNQQNIVRWRTKKVKELFLFLWQHQGTPIHKAVVMEQLWPDTHIDKAATLLHTTVYQLRKTFKENGIENAIQFINERYTLGVFIDSDYTKLIELLDASKMEASKVEEILSLYEGDFLEEEDLSWAVSIQQNLRHSVLQYFERVISNDERDLQLVEKCLVKMLKIDYYNESYMYQLLTFYNETKSSQKMKEFYKTVEVRLRDDLGIEIPPEIVRLYEQNIQFD